MLLDWMPFGSRTLWKNEFREMKDLHAKWEAQAYEIVEKLHAVDIVWGDVNPENMVIDFDFNLWVVDFGGGFIDGFVDRRLAGTKEGVTYKVSRGSSIVGFSQMMFESADYLGSTHRRSRPNKVHCKSPHGYVLTI